MIARYTKKCCMLIAFLAGMAGIINAQHYEQFGTPMGLGSGDYGYYDNYGDSVSFIFVGLPPGAYGNSYLSVFFYGDDGNPGENVDVYMDYNYLGNRANNSGGDCAPEDSVAMPVSFSALNTYTSNDTIIVTCWPSLNVDFFCGQTTLRCKLIYDYCPFGMPAQFASFSIADTILCPSQAPVALTGTPAGGTYSGTGVSGNTFVANGLNAGNYSITYTATDSIGCITSATHTVLVQHVPPIMDYFICEGDTATFTPSSGYKYVWYSQPNYNGLIDTTIGSLTTGPFYQPTTLYVADAIVPMLYRVDSFQTSNSSVVDLQAITGFTSSLLAITDSFVYAVGGISTARYDLDLLSGTALPAIQGLFSDLGTKKLYSFCSDLSGTLLVNGDDTLFAIQELNSNLQPVGQPLSLTTPVPVSTVNSLLLMGAGVVGIYNPSNNQFYVISNFTGTVTNLGQVTYPPTGVATAGMWACTGILEYDGTSYSALYKGPNMSPTSIIRQTMPAGIPVDHTAFSGDLGFALSFTFSGSNNRWYFGYVFPSTTFGGMNVTLGYADGQDTIVFLPESIGCYASFDVNMDLINLGNDTTVCQNQTPVVIEAGNGYQSYTWNGVNNNWNIYPVTASGQYIVDAVNGIGCHVKDTINVTISPCLGIENETTLQASVYPNPSNGNFNVQIIPTEGGQAEIEVIDMQGRKLYTRVVEVFPAINTLAVSLSGITDGIYLVNVRFKDHSSNFKMIIKQ